MAIYSSPTTMNLTDSPANLFVWLNDVTRYWFSNGLLMVIWILFLMGYLSVNKDDYVGASATASYVTAVIGLIGWLMGLVSGLAMGLIIGVSLITTAWLLADRRG